MAESLGRAWIDLTNLLDQRLVVLNQNYLFQGHLKDFMEKTRIIEAMAKVQSSAVTKSPEEVRSEVSSLNGAKKSMLEASVYALQEGEGLLAKLNALWTQATLDSRPAFIKRSVALAIEQVRLFFDNDLYRKSVAG